MEYADVKEWLDIMVERYKKATEEVYLLPRISARVSNDDNVLIYRSIDVIADIMGLELHEEFGKFRDGEEYLKYWFTYDDVEFASYPSGRLESFACRSESTVE